MVAVTGSDQEDDEDEVAVVESEQKDDEEKW